MQSPGVPQEQSAEYSTCGLSFPDDSSMAIRSGLLMHGTVWIVSQSSSKNCLKCAESVLEQHRKIARYTVIETHRRLKEGRVLPRSQKTLATGLNWADSEKLINQKKNDLQREMSGQFYADAPLWYRVVENKEEVAIQLNFPLLESRVRRCIRRNPVQRGE